MISIQHSAPGIGSKFSLQFQAKIFSHDNPIDLKQHTTEHLKQALEGVSVLVVDDSPDNLLLIKKMLTKSGAIVELAAGGREGLAKAKAGMFAPILMDIQMPEMDGYQVLREILDLGLRAPVIALTAHAMTEDRLKTKEAGFADHVTKPLSFPVLVGTMCAALIKTKPQIDASI
ncbi:MAG: response regulator [Chitinophagaceae bacterium]|nr:response regulator [Oligoflexus sp.]